LYIKFHENSFGGSQVVTMVAELFGQWNVQAEC
jgi:hypothetical protein